MIIFRVYLLQKPRRHIRRRYHTQPFDLHHHPLLSPHTCHLSNDPLEISFYNSYQITTFVAALFRVDQLDVFVVDAGDADKVHHFLVVDGEWWVFALGICLKVVVIIR